MTWIRRIAQKKLLLPVILTTAALVFALVIARTKHERSNFIKQMFGGNQGLAAVAHPLLVEAFRLGPLPNGSDWATATPSDYPTVAGPIPVPAPIASQVSETLTSTRPHGVEAARGCSPRFGVRFSFHGAHDSLDVLFCFECNILWVFRNGSRTGGEGFDYVRPNFVRAVKSLFPGDEEIQDLREGTRSHGGGKGT